MRQFRNLERSHKQLSFPGAVHVLEFLVLQVLEQDEHKQRDRFQAFGGKIIAALEVVKALAMRDQLIAQRCKESAILVLMAMKVAVIGAVIAAQVPAGSKQPEHVGESLGKGSCRRLKIVRRHRLFLSRSTLPHSRRVFLVDIPIVHQWAVFDCCEVQ